MQFSVKVRVAGETYVVEGDAVVALGRPETGRFGPPGEAEPAEGDEVEIDWATVTVCDGNGDVMGVELSAGERRLVAELVAEQAREGRA